MPAVPELRSITDRSHDGGGGLRPDALNPGDTLAGLAVLEHAFDLLVERADPAVEIAEEIVEFTDGFARHRRQFVLEVRQDLGDRTAGTGDALADSEAAIEQQAADLADNGGAVIDHALPGAMQCLDILLLNGLLRDEWNVRLTCAVQIASNLRAQQKPPLQASMTTVHRSICAMTASN